MTRWGRTGVLTACAAVLMLGTSQARADLILSDNLAQSTDGTMSATGNTMLAAAFGTDGLSYSLESISLLLQRTSIGGALEVDLYRDGGLEPGSLIAALSGPASISTTLEAVTFSSSSAVILDPNSTYWVVLKSLTGSFDWAWTSSDVGDGPGFQALWASSDDSGGSWFPSTDYPFQMSVSARAVPEPGSLSLVALGAGTLLVGERVRRRRRSREAASTRSPRFSGI